MEKWKNGKILKLINIKINYLLPLTKVISLNPGF